MRGNKERIYWLGLMIVAGLLAGVVTILIVRLLLSVNQFVLGG